MINGLDIYYSKRISGEGLKPVSTNKKQRVSGLKPLTTRGKGLKPITKKGGSCAKLEKD